MLSRTLEVVLIALLVMLTLGVAFQFQNQQLLRDILGELQHQRVAAQQAARAPAPAPAEAPPAAYRLPGMAPAPAPAPAMAPVVEEPVVVAAAPMVAADPKPQPQPRPVVKPAPAPAPVATVTQPQPKPALPPPAVAPAETPPAAVAATAEPVKPEPDPKVEEAWQAHGPIVTQIVSDLCDGQYDRVVKRLNATMAANLPVDRIAAVMDPLRQKHGALKRIVEHELLTGALDPNLRGWKVVAEQNDDSHTEFWITLDEQNRIAGLLMK